MTYKNLNITTGYNYAYQNKNMLKSVHAECSAIYNAGKVNSVCGDVYVARLGSTRQIVKMSRPCDNCLSSMKKVGIKNIYYTMDTPIGELMKIGVIRM